MAVEFWPARALKRKQATTSELVVQYSSGNYAGTGPQKGRSTFITPADQGIYIDILVHAQLSNAAGAKNGVLQTWLRHKGQSACSQIHNVTDADMDPRLMGNNSEASFVGSPTALQSFQRGYLFGWQNSGYDLQSVFRISRVDYI